MNKEERDLRRDVIASLYEEKNLEVAQLAAIFSLSIASVYKSMKRSGFVFRSGCRAERTNESKNESEATDGRDPDPKPKGCEKCKGASPKLSCQNIRD